MVYEGFHTVFLYVLLQTDQKTRPGGRAHPSLPGAHGCHSQNRSVVLEFWSACLRGPHAALLVFPRCPGTEPDVALLHVQLSHPSGAFCPLFQAPFLPNSVFISVLSLLPLIVSSAVYSRCVCPPHFIPSLSWSSSQAMHERSNVKKTCKG